jgi:hypothetical protein
MRIVKKVLHVSITLSALFGLLSCYTTFARIDVYDTYSSKDAVPQDDTPVAMDEEGFPIVYRDVFIAYSHWPFAFVGGHYYGYPWGNAGYCYFPPYSLGPWYGIPGFGIWTPAPWHYPYFAAKPRPPEKKRSFSKRDYRPKERRRPSRKPRDFTASRRSPGPSTEVSRSSSEESSNSSARRTRKPSYNPGAGSADKPAATASRPTRSRSRSSASTYDSGSRKSSPQTGSQNRNTTKNSRRRR